MGLNLTFGRSLKALPKEFSNLKHLIYLHLGNCQGLKYLPNSIGELKKLKNLHLGFCSFKYLPERLGELKMLVVLDLENCANLECLLEAIGKLEKLVTLNLFQCSALRKPPFQLHYLKRLESLNFLGCHQCHLFNYVENNSFISLRNLKIDAHSIKYIIPLHVRSVVIHNTLNHTLYQVQSMKELEDLTLHTGDITEFYSHIKPPIYPQIGCLNLYEIFLNLKSLKLSILPNLQNLRLNNCPNLVNLTLNDCPNLEFVALNNCPNLVRLLALDSLPKLGSLVLNLSIKELSQSFTHRGAFPALDSFNPEHSQLVEFPGVEEGAMPKLSWLNFDDCKFLHTLPTSISLLTTIETITLGSKNEKLITSCKTNFRNSIIRKSFIVDGKPLIPEEEVFELLVPMEGTTTIRGNDKRPFQKVHGDDEERLFKRGGSILGSDFFAPSNPKTFVYLGSSSLA